MKLLSLNIWGGRIHKPLLEFLEKHSEIDIFCFQEVYQNAKGKEVIYTDAMLDIYEEIEKALSDYQGYYRPHLQDYYGLAIFVKKTISVIEEGEHFVHRQKGYVPTDHVGFHAKNVQYLKIPLSQKMVTFFNFHGLWNGKGKTDTEDRLNQSKRIKEFMNSIEGEKIMCGDFNLNPDTESLKILEGGMVNLIKTHDITSTRTERYTKPEKFADYMLISLGIKEIAFEVLSDVVSDHTPMFLEFEIN